MSAQIIDGKAIAKEIREEIKLKVKKLQRKGFVPGLAVILVGDDPASQVYVNNKAKACQECGIRSQVIRMPEVTSEEELLQLIQQLNENNEIHGILVQLPLPHHIRETLIIEAINPLKDVDGLHPENVGKLWNGNAYIKPCTPYGCIELLRRTIKDFRGKKAVVVGRSILMGKPIAALLLSENATVTICHSYTQNLPEITRTADILIVAVGKPGYITGEMIKPGAVVLDVGTSRLTNGKLVGDVDYESAFERAGWITPVPGGVGPMTITMLLQNTLEAANEQKNLCGK